MPCPRRGAEPLRPRQFGKLLAHQLAQHLGAFFVGVRMRYLAKVTLDTGHAFAFVHGPDVVQHHSTDRDRVRRAEQHGQYPAARAADEYRRPHAKLEKYAEDVAELGNVIIVRMTGIVFGVAAAARSEGDHMPFRRAGGERWCEFVEISS